MHLNSCLMIGRVSPKGPQLRYAESGTPLCSFVLEVDEVTHGRIFTVYIPCEISGKFAEQTSTEVEAGDILQIAGKWRYKSIVDPKSGVKVSKPVVSSWGISQRLPAERSSSGEGDSPSKDEIVEPGGAQAGLPSKKGKPRYPKHLKHPWHPTGLLSEH